MTDVRAMVSSREAESGFYPTPVSLAAKMCGMVDWRKVETILEPSAGKGDLAMAAARNARMRFNGTYDLAKVDLDCVEIDPSLRAILKAQGLRVVHDDFLTYQTMKRYDLVIMNPPFEDAARHILKALSLLRAGGQLVALCNAETIRNPYTNDRNRLVRELGEAKIEYIQDAFKGAERKTGVEIALIHYKAPAEEMEASLILEKLKPAHKYVNMGEEEYAALAKSDFVEVIIDKYNFEIETGLRLIHEWRSVSKGLTGEMHLTIGLDKPANENEWVKLIRHKYWSMLFASPQFVSQLTNNLRTQLYNMVSTLDDYEFSYFNIKEIMIQMNAQVSKGVEGTIMELFDDWTRKYHWDENAQNRHYFDGWCTNDAFAVNKKVIIPLRAFTDWGGKWEAEFRAYNVRERLQDIEKVFNYLDGGRTPEKDLTEVLAEAENAGTTRRIESKYFYLTFYKKGTCHLEFKNMDLLAKFNIFAAKGKNWLPPSFGRKRYEDLDTAEKKVVDSFMGDGKKYNAVVAHADYFLASGQEMIGLTAG